MARKAAARWLIDDVADFLAGAPSRDKLLAYRPSRETQDRLSTLLDKAKKGALTADEEWELQQFEYVEMLMQAVKARLRAPRSVPS